MVLLSCAGANARNDFLFGGGLSPSFYLWQSTEKSLWLNLGFDYATVPEFYFVDYEPVQGQPYYQGAENDVAFLLVHYFALHPRHLRFAA